MRNVTVTVVAAACVFVGLLAFAALAADEPPILPIDAEARAKVAQDPQVGCKLADKTFDAAKQRLTYNLRLQNKTKKAVVKFTGLFIWRDAAGENLVFELKEVVFEKALAPGATANREDSSEAPQGGDAVRRLQWEKEVNGVVEVRLSVARITYADGTTELRQVKGGEK